VIFLTVSSQICTTCSVFLPIYEEQKQWRIQGNLFSSALSGVASPTIWSCYANIKSLSLFISLEIDCFHGLWTRKYLHSMTKWTIPQLTKILISTSLDKIPS
jgi:hypothetical protein